MRITEIICYVIKCEVVTVPHPSTSDRTLGIYACRPLQLCQRQETTFSKQVRELHTYMLSGITSIGFNKVFAL
jgi:hypothetical protein